MFVTARRVAASNRRTIVTVLPLVSEANVSRCCHHVARAQVTNHHGSAIVTTLRSPSTCGYLPTTNARALSSISRRGERSSVKKKAPPGSRPKAPLQRSTVPRRPTHLSPHVRKVRYMQRVMNTYSIEQLHDLCRLRGLSMAGQKVDIAERVYDDLLSENLVNDFDDDDAAYPQFQQGDHSASSDSQKSEFESESDAQDLSEPDITVASRRNRRNDDDADVSHDTQPTRTNPTSSTRSISRRSLPNVATRRTRDDRSPALRRPEVSHDRTVDPPLSRRGSMPTMEPTRYWEPRTVRNSREKYRADEHDRIRAATDRDNQALPASEEAAAKEPLLFQGRPVKRIIQCPVCAQQFRYQKGLVMHVARKPTCRAQMSCPDCFRTFTTPEGLALHLEFKHEKCPVHNQPPKSLRSLFRHRP